MGASGRVSNKAQWRGQPSRQAVKSRAEASVIEDRSPPENFRFLDSATKRGLSLAPMPIYTDYLPAYQVTSLPDVAYDIGEMYSGLVPIDERNKSRALFFIFQPTIGPPVDEITIWLNGGPGLLQTFTVGLSMVTDDPQVAARLKGSFKRMVDFFGRVVNLLPSSTHIHGSSKSCRNYFKKSELTGFLV